MISRTTRRRVSKYLQGSAGRAIAAALVFGMVGVLVLQLTSAETFVNSAESESGSISGAASKINDNTASNGQSVSFGAAIPAPTNVQAITGGNSIALLWDMPRFGVKSVEVYRNDAKVATIMPGHGTLRAEKLGTRYIDKSVSGGQSYQYKVRLITQGNNTSAFSSIVSATQPNLGNTTPVPTVIIEASQASNLTNYLSTYAKSEVETWYPKISDAIAYPNYTPRNSITLLMDTSNADVATADYRTGIISVNPSWLRDNPEDGGGMFVHEATHIAQAYPANDPSGWIQEGIADWSRDWLTRERFYIPAPNAQLGGYSEGGLVAQWTQTKYDPGFIRKLNIAMHNNAYSAPFVANLTGGRSASQLFAEAKQANYGSTGTIVGINGKCIEVANNNPTTGGKLQLAPCSNSSGQKWTTIYRDAGLHGSAKKTLHFVNSAVAANGQCIDVYGFATVEGSTVWPWNCNWQINQEWVKQTDGSLMNPYSGKCLSTAGKSSDNGAQIVIAACDDSTAQRWNI